MHCKTISTRRCRLYVYVKLLVMSFLHQVSPVSVSISARFKVFTKPATVAAVLYLPDLGPSMNMHSDKVGKET